MVQAKNENFRSINCGELSAPRVEIHQAWWAMIGLGSQGKEWSQEEKFNRISEAGFSGVLGTSAELIDGSRWVELVDRHKLLWGIGLGPWDGEKIFSYMREAKEAGASYANIQPGDSFMIGREAFQFLQRIMEESLRIGLPCFFETHRGRITQDLLRTVEYVTDIPAMRLTIDFSHYVLAGEMQQVESKTEHYFDALLRCCSAIHLRVSNGQQIQIELRQNYQTNPFVKRFIQWWRKGVEYWQANARPGDILPLVCELGPPAYSITQTSGNETVEQCDRWQQALLLKEIVETQILTKIPISE